MSNTVTNQAPAENPLAKFVSALSQRPAVDIEKVLLHLLDNAKNYWGERANTALRALQDKTLSEEDAKAWKAEYNLAFEAHNEVCRMRFGIATAKRTW